MSKSYWALDNGVTGTIAWIGDNGSGFIETPVKKEQSYTKARNIITRIDAPKLKAYFEQVLEGHPGNIMAVMERPMISNFRFKASISAARSLEATLCVLESLGVPLLYVDSRQWQSVMLPKGTKGTPDLKKASMDIGCRLFPQHSELIKKHKDADALLIAEWARRTQL